MCEEKGYADLIPDLRRINQASTHLLSLINNVLDLAKIEAGRMDLVLEEVAVEGLVREVEAVLPPLVEKNGNTLVVQLGEGLGMLHADGTKLRQALLNLLSNACKFTERGTITLAVSRIAEADGQDRLTFTVTDTGIGMTVDQQARLFSTFSQAEADTQRRYGGTGLGLTLSREFCRLMGGDISVTSEPGVGSTFTVRLPVWVGAKP